MLRASTPIEERLIELLEPAAADLGYRLVRVRLSGLKRKRLQIMAEREDGSMRLEDCEALSRAISPVLDASDPIRGEYDLEVSSPGIDRPLVRLEDFARFAGHEAKLETLQMIDGRKRFRGVLKGVEGDVVVFDLPEGEAAIPFAQLAEARLVLTDRLIEEDLKRAKAAELDQDHIAVLPREGDAADAVGRRGRSQGGVQPPPQSALRADSSPSRGSTAPQIDKTTKRKPS
ncbi:MAG: ribosome maturation factor RimP [Alphaproteobacteria bacterium]|nr:ribosome maturation factor RimP [Alphaproteobacteria bacterium]